MAVMDTNRKGQIMSAAASRTSFETPVSGLSPSFIDAWRRHVEFFARRIA
jgi:hypothetical protein